MIDPKELRIGAHYAYKGSRVEISTIGEWQFTYAHKTEVGMIDDLQPIPLTPEILTELGFEKMEEFGGVSAWQKDNLIVKIIGKRKVAYCVAKTHYLHQLENLVYQTTKNELIK